MVEDVIYEGEERRSQTRVFRCDHHSEHATVLASLAEDIRELRNDSKLRREQVDSNVDKKLDTRFAVIILTTFLIPYIIGIVAVYRGVHANRLFMTEVKAELQIQLNNINNQVQLIKDQVVPQPVPRR